MRGTKRGATSQTEIVLATPVSSVSQNAIWTGGSNLLAAALGFSCLDIGHGYFSITRSWFKDGTLSKTYTRDSFIFLPDREGEGAD